MVLAMAALSDAANEEHVLDHTRAAQSNVACIPPIQMVSEY